MGQYATFREVVDKRVTYQPPKSESVADNLGLVRGKFQNLADDLAPLVPEGPDATVAANAIGDACQKVIQAIIYNQEG
jgi:hypothetical protein